MMCIYQAALKSSFPERLWLSERLSRFFSVFKDQFYTAVIPDLLKNTAGIHQLHTWEGMSGNQLFRETKLSSQHSHFIFVKVFQWFYYFTLKKKKKIKKAIYTPAHISKQKASNIYVLAPKLAWHHRTSAKDSINTGKEFHVNVGFVEQLQDRGWDQEVRACARTICGSSRADWAVRPCLHEFRPFFSLLDVQTNPKTLCAGIKIRNGDC